MWNQESDSPRDIVLSQMRVGSAYDEKLTDASLVLAAMQRGRLSAFDVAKRFVHTDGLTRQEIYNRLYAYVRWGIERKRPIEGDRYASSEEWSAFFEWRISELNRR